MTVSVEEEVKTAAQLREELEGLRGQARKLGVDIRRAEGDLAEAKRHRPAAVGALATAEARAYMSPSPESAAEVKERQDALDSLDARAEALQGQLQGLYAQLQEVNRSVERFDRAFVVAAQSECWAALAGRVPAPLLRAVVALEQILDALHGLDVLRDEIVGLTPGSQRAKQAADAEVGDRFLELGRLLCAGLEPLATAVLLHAHRLYPPESARPLMGKADTTKPDPLAPLLQGGAPQWFTDGLELERERQSRPRSSSWGGSRPGSGRKPKVADGHEAPPEA